MRFLSVLILGLCACAHDRVQVKGYEYRGYRFEALVGRHAVCMRVPCCQTYVADENFRKLAADGYWERFGFRSEGLQYTEDWEGKWQLVQGGKCP